MGVGENVFTLYDMRGSTLLPALLLLCPGLGCIRGRIRACIPAIYLHSGRVAGSPVVLTIDGAGMMMTKNRALFLLPKVRSSFYPLLLVPVLRARVPGSGFIGKMALFLFPVFWGFSGGLGFFRGSGCGGIPPSLIPGPLSLDP